ncbi:MAG: DUF2071 domain-containing protein [Acidobacteria bacterium]|nr:DUF2071 domain-containing protein [Acidobacteriota bacterium]
MHPALKVVDHRPFPLPAGPWIMKQEWGDLLFAHWPLAPEYLRPLVPAELPLDTFDKQAWIAVTPFHMTGVRPRAVPPMPGLSAFPELNVRTYVRIANKPGVFFFSLDCANAPAVWGARTLYHLPYFRARMSVTIGNQGIVYSSQRVGERPAELHGTYGAVSHPFRATPGTLEHFLIERYCLYTVYKRQTYRADIHHVPWPLQNARATFAVNTMAAAAGVALPDTDPLLHFAKHLEVLIWPLRRVS